MQTTVTFEYLFGCNSYQGCWGNCQNAALFGAWLIDTTTGIGENLAKVPNTNLPISIVTVRDESKTNVTGVGCGTSINPQYFGNAYGNAANQLPQASAP